MAKRKTAAASRKDPKPSDLRERNERFDDYCQEYATARSTGPVVALRTFSARVVRAHDEADQSRGVEMVAKGDIVDVPIDRGEDSVQGANVVAFMRVNGDFEPAPGEDLTEPPDDDIFHGHLTTDEVTRQRKRAAALAGEDDGEQMTITKGELKDLVAGAVAAALQAHAPKGGGKAPAAEAAAA